MRVPSPGTGTPLYDSGINNLQGEWETSIIAGENGARVEPQSQPELRSHRAGSELGIVEGRIKNRACPPSALGLRLCPIREFKSPTFPSGIRPQSPSRKGLYL